MKRLGVAAYITKRTGDVWHVLLGRRGKDPNRGLLVLPGGGVEEGETLEQALQREMLEETGLTIAPFAPRWEQTHIIELDDRLVMIALARIKTGSGKMRDGDDLYDVAWYLPPAKHEVSPVVVPFLELHGYLQESEDA